MNKLSRKGVEAGVEAVKDYLTSRQVYIMDELVEAFEEAYDKSSKDSVDPTNT